jgi:nitroreductase
MNTVIECLNNHRSIRKFKSDPVDPEMLDAILHAGIRGATGGNLQLYTLIVIDDKEKLKELELDFAPVVIAALVDTHRVKRWLEINNPPDTEIHNENTHHFFMAFCDAVIAIQNIVIAAESLGLGTCYYGKIVATDVQEFFGAPEYVFPAAMVTVGHPDEDPGLSIRLPMEAVAHRNEYRDFTDEEIRTLYKEREESVWNNLTDELKEKLAEKGIHHIAHGIARRKFSKEAFGESAEATREIFRKSMFDL